MKKLLYFLLLIIFLLDLFFVWNGENEPRFFTKTLLLPLLVIIYVVESKRLSSSPLQINKLFLTGLILSFFGDLFLLFDWGFLPGLGSFLMAHVLYIITFFKFKKKNPSVLITAGISVYLFGLLFFLFPHLNEMKIPVIIYGTVISAMLWFGVRTRSKLLILGALLFVISDTLLAFNIFVNQNAILSLLVMITYVFAQYMLVKGMLKKT